MTKVKALTEQYVAVGEKIATMCAEIFTLQGERLGATTTEARDISERIADLDSEANRLMRESAAPMGSELEKLLSDVAKASSEREAKVAADMLQTMSSSEQLALAVGIA